MLYFAYGSNLSFQNMRRRCPAAKVVRNDDGSPRRMYVTNAALVFRGAADVVVRKGKDNVVPGGLWRLTLACERMLDQCEGVVGKTYLKRYFKLEDGRDVLFYQMSISRGIMPPEEEYLATITQGYRDFGLGLDYLRKALDESWRTKYVTDRLRQRHMRRGQPKLARKIVA
jgi:hypothetical protein